MALALNTDSSILAACVQKDDTTRYTYIYFVDPLTGNKLYNSVLIAS